MTEQAVIETNDESTTQTEDNNAQDDLDSLLSQFEEEEVKQPDNPAKEAQQNDEKAAHIEQMYRDLINQRTEQDLTLSANKVKELVDVDDEWIKAIISYRAQRDQRFLQAWLDRDKKPGLWDKVLMALAKDMKSKYIDKDATDAHNDVVAAVKSASTQSKETGLPDAHVLAGLSDKEFEERKRAILRGKV